MATGVLSRAGGIISHGLCWWGELEGSNGLDELATVVLTVVAITVAAISSYLTWKKKADRGLLPPGPTGLPLLGSLPFLGPDLHRCFADLAKRYGPVMSIRLGTKLWVVVSSPAAAKEVLRDHDAVFANRDPPAVATVISYGRRDIAWNNDPASWRLLRKLCVRELMNPSTIEALYALRRSEVRRAVREVYGRCGAPIGVREVSFLTILDMTTNMLWGSTLGGVERSSVGKEFLEVVKGVTELLGLPNVSDLIPAMARFDLQGLDGRMKTLLAWYDRIVSKVIDERSRWQVGDGVGGEGQRSSGSRGKDFLQVMLEAVDKAAEASVTIDNVKAVMLDVVVGATDTSSTTVEWAMAEILSNREILNKVQRELDAVVGADAVVEESHLPKLQYLDAVVKETLRLHPAVPFLIPRGPREPSTLGGHHVPAGTKVLINTWFIHRDPSSWEDPLEFKPERFLTGDSKWDYHGGNGFRFLPFGSGRRMCPGIPMAERMTNFLLATFLHSFDWQILAGQEVDVTEKVGIVLGMARPLAAVPTPRLSDPQLYA